MKICDINRQRNYLSFRVLECDIKLINYKLEIFVYNVLQIQEAQLNENFVLEMYIPGEIKNKICDELL